MAKRKRKLARRSSQPAPPEICSFNCPYSDFPPAYTAGACRTMSAVYCRKLRRLVDRNRPCHWRAASGA
ncbi:MAG: hypothetical protein BIFFINMI_00204 [Phycisphaerae bacterium]|nr:hypothetical protein [Phycisphaerae bacterium]